MKIAFADLKQHVVDFVQRERLAVGAAEHKLLERLVAYAEGKQGELDSVAYLRSLGYVVTAPPTVMPPSVEGRAPAP